MFLRAPNAARLLDLPLSTFYQLVREGRLPPAVSTVGRHRLWSREQLVAAVDPKGYKASHDEAEAAAGHPSATKTKWTGPLLLASGPRHGLPGASYQASRRSPYAGILGGSGDSSPILGFSGSATGQDRGHG